MGVAATDIYTFWHFVFGLLCSLAGINIYVSNFIHLLIELNEKTYRDGKKVESFVNHTGDIIAFFLGSLAAKEAELQSQILKNLLLFVILAEATQETLREL